MKAALIAFLVASSAMGAQGEATGFEFDLPLQCGKHLLPPSVCYPKGGAYEALNAEVQRLQAVEKDAQAAGDRRLIFFATGAILGAITGLLLGGYAAWLIFK